MVLIDTSVVSELRKPRPHGVVLAWLHTVEDADVPDTLFEDAMIAATASVHKLTVVTRNVADFAVFDVQVLNPFKTPKG
jgi:predicted nucleic acid-binding protein